MGEHSDRRTGADRIFDYLRDELVSLRLGPGDKLSEAEVASRFGVSHQPVRDAFNRLANLDLVLIRPQRATAVKRFSRRQIGKSRFVSVAVGVEVLRCAARRCDGHGSALLDDSLARQAEAIAQGAFGAFGQLAFDFRRTLCEIGQVDPSRRGRARREVQGRSVVHARAGLRRGWLRRPDGAGRDDVMPIDRKTSRTKRVVR